MSIKLFGYVVAFYLSIVLLFGTLHYTKFDPESVPYIVTKQVALIPFYIVISIIEFTKFVVKGLPNVLSQIATYVCDTSILITTYVSNIVTPIALYIWDI